MDREQVREMITAIRNINESKETVPYKPSREITHFWKSVDKYIEAGKKMTEKEDLRFGGCNLTRLNSR